MTLPPVTPGLRRAAALCRDERRLADALAEHERRRFDIDTAVRLRERADDLVETMTTVFHDDDLWETLAGTAARPLTADQLDGLRELDDGALVPLLELAGYTTPPPPPAGELVDDTLSALHAALAGPTADPGAAVREARFLLGTAVLRIRRQLDTADELRGDGAGVLRAAARRLGRLARRYIPPVVGVAVGAVVELQLPGSGAGFVLGRAAQKAAELGVEWAARVILGRLAERGAGGDRGEPGELPAMAIESPALVHSIGLLDALHRLRDGGGGDGGPAGQLMRDELARLALRHLARLDDAAADLAAEPELHGRLAALRADVEALRWPGSDGPDGSGEAAERAVAAAVRLQGELVEWAEQVAGRFG